MAEVDYCPLSGAIGWVVRFSVVWTCASVLCLKKINFEPDRPWRDFLLDCSKQALGAFWAWALMVPTPSCGDYWLSTVVETTLGLLVEYLALVFLTRKFAEVFADAQVFATGVYADQAGRFIPGNYALQLIIWLGCCTCMAGLAGVTALVYQPLAEQRVLRTVSLGVQQVEMLVTVLVTPCLLHGLQVWITDDFLKEGGEPLEIAEVLARLRLWAISASHGCADEAASSENDYVPPMLTTGLQAAASSSHGTAEEEDHDRVPALAGDLAHDVQASSGWPGDAQVLFREESDSLPWAEEATPERLEQYRAHRAPRELADDVEAQTSSARPPEKVYPYVSTFKVPRDAPTSSSADWPPCGGLALFRQDSDILPWAETVTSERLQQYRADRGAPPATAEELAAALEAAAVVEPRPISQPYFDGHIGEPVPAEAMERYKAERTGRRA